MRSASLLLAVMLVVAASVPVTPQSAGAPPAASPRAASPATQRGVTADSATRQRLAIARAIIKAARFAALITQDDARGSSARTIDPAPPDSAMVIRFVTNARSRKVGQMARDARVTLYYFDATGMRYVSVHGVAREVRDAATKARLWYREWTPFYPARERGAALYEVLPRRLELVSEKDGVVGDSLTWAVPVVRFPGEQAARRR
jgi:general stress protein 26